jgi:hypothetical protein
MQPTIRESDVVRAMKLLKDRAVLQSELRHCNERGRLFSKNRARIYLGDHFLAGDRAEIPAHVIIEPLVQFLNDRIAAITLQIRALGIAADKIAPIIEDDGLKVVPSPSAEDGSPAAESVAAAQLSETETTAPAADAADGPATAPAA